MQAWFVFLVAAGLSLPTSVNADDRPAEGSPAPGARIRVWQRDRAPGPLLGTLLELGKSELTLRSQNGPDAVTIPLQAVSRIDVSVGHRGNAGKGALVGMAVGWLVIFLDVKRDPGECAPAGKCAALFATFVGAPVGALTGGLIGSLVKTERWREVPPALPPRDGATFGGPRVLTNFSFRF
jgi:hypothetical protein